MAKHSIATVSLSGSLDEKLCAIAGAGFDAVEIFENDLLTFNGSPRDVGQLCRDLGLSFARSSRFAISRACPSRSEPVTLPGRSTSSN
jgi:4-hydroxyphenylpyruvate dioxygenase